MLGAKLAQSADILVWVPCSSMAHVCRRTRAMTNGSIMLGTSLLLLVVESLALPESDYKI